AHDINAGLLLGRQHDAGGVDQPLFARRRDQPIGDRIGAHRRGADSRRWITHVDSLPVTPRRNSPSGYLLPDSGTRPFRGAHGATWVGRKRRPPSVTKTMASAANPQAVKPTVRGTVVPSNCWPT